MKTEALSGGQLPRRFELYAHGFRWTGDSLGDRREIDPGQVEICRRFLSACKPSKKAGVGSYGLKHVVERWASEYVSNGACIQAAIDLGLPVVPQFRGYSLFQALAGGSDSRFRDERPLNAYIGVSRGSVAHTAAGKAGG